MTPDEAQKRIAFLAKTCDELRTEISVLTRKLEAVVATDRRDLDWKNSRITALREDVAKMREKRDQERTRAELAERCMKAAGKVLEAARVTARAVSDLEDSLR